MTDAKRSKGSGIGGAGGAGGAGRVAGPDSGFRQSRVPASGPCRAPTAARGAGQSPVPASGLRQVSLARLKEFGITPKRDLGQNFLIDDNILGVILGLLECGPDDVVLEIGAGLGVLTAVLADVARHVHAFEVDRSLEEPLAATLRGDSNVDLHFEDVLKSPLEDLDPAPSLCASNLPYSVAGPFLIESLQRLPGVRRYTVMVQREVADRLAASPGSKAYGVLSVYVQLYARIARMRPLSRSIFYPQPRVDSSLIVLERLGPAQIPQCDPVRLRAVVQAAFAQRRKTLVNALGVGSGLSREQVLSALHSFGLPSDVRAERLAPRQFVSLAEGMRDRPADRAGGGTPPAY